MSHHAKLRGAVPVSQGAPSFMTDTGPALQPNTVALGTLTYCTARIVLVGVCESDAALRPPHLLIQSSLLC